MRLILTAEVKDLGKQGDVVEVADGYARNYLLPRNKAVKATDASLANAEAVRIAREEAERVAKEKAEGVASQLVGTRVVLAAQSGDEGRLYGSVTVSDVIEGIRKFTGIELERNNLEITAPIREIGLHEVNVSLHPEVEFPLTLDIIPT